MTIFRRSAKSLPSSGVVGGGNPASFSPEDTGARGQRVPLCGDDAEFESTDGDHTTRRSPAGSPTRPGFGPRIHAATCSGGSGRLRK